MSIQVVRVALFQGPWADYRRSQKPGTGPPSKPKAWQRGTNRALLIARPNLFQFADCCDGLAERVQAVSALSGAPIRRTTCYEEETEEPFRL